MAMNARASENYLAISRSSSASKSVGIFWAEIYWGRLLAVPVSYYILFVIFTGDTGSYSLSVFYIP
jgi:hypothetical protein